MNLVRLLLIAVFAGSLGACQTLNDTWNGIKNFDLPANNNEQQNQAEARLVCPKVKIVDELSSLSDFSDISDPAEYNLISRVNLSQVESSCSYDGRNMVVDLKLAFEGQLGPRGKAKDTDQPTFTYPFFIAVTDDSGKIKAKEVFGASLTYTEYETYHTYYESLRQIIPVENEAEARNFTVLVGFQLSQYQLQYNRKHMVPVGEQTGQLERSPESEGQAIQKFKETRSDLREEEEKSEEGSVTITSTGNLAVKQNPETTGTKTELAAVTTTDQKKKKALPLDIRPKVKPAEIAARARSPSVTPPQKPLEIHIDETQQASAEPESMDIPEKPESNGTSDIEPASGPEAEESAPSETSDQSVVFRSPANYTSGPNQSDLRDPREEKRQPVSLIDLPAPVEE